MPWPCWLALLVPAAALAVRAGRCRWRRPPGRPASGPTSRSRGRSRSRSPAQADREAGGSATGRSTCRCVLRRRPSPSRSPSARSTSTASCDPYVPGQIGGVRAILGKRVIKSRHWLRQAVEERRYGCSAESLSSPGAGGVTVEVTHTANHDVPASRLKRSLRGARQQHLIRLEGPVRAADPAAPRGASLLHPADRRLRQGTGLAVDAYHRLLAGAPPRRSTAARSATCSNGWGEFKVRYPTTAATPRATSACSCSR